MNIDGENSLIDEIIGELVIDGPIKHNYINKFLEGEIKYATSKGQITDELLYGCIKVYVKTLNVNSFPDFIQPTVNIAKQIIQISDQTKIENKETVNQSRRIRNFVHRILRHENLVLKDFFSLIYFLKIESRENIENIAQRFNFHLGRVEALSYRITQYLATNMNGEEPTNENAEVENQVDEGEAIVIEVTDNEFDDVLQANISEINEEQKRLAEERMARHERIKNGITVFVCNLNFDTTYHSFNELICSKELEIIDFKIALGRAFIYCDNSAIASEVVSKLDNVVFEGRKLRATIDRTRNSTSSNQGNDEDTPRDVIRHRRRHHRAVDEDEE